MIYKILYKFVVISLTISSLCFGQTNLENNLSKILNLENSYSTEYVKNYLKGYMQPFATAFGTTVSGAMYHRATIKEFPRFDVGINAVYLYAPEESKTFSDPQNYSAPTVFGNANFPLHDASLPGGLGKSSMLVPQIQINLGLISNFEITARYLNFNIKEYGNFTFSGLGVKYGFGKFVPIFPIDLSVQAMYHKFSISDWLDSGTIGMNIHLSQELLLLPLQFYGGLGFENTSMIIKTSSILNNNSSTVGDISIEGENKFRFNLGLSWTMVFFNIHADFNFGKYNSLGFGTMIIL